MTGALVAGAVVIRNHSWGLVETTVLEVWVNRNRYIVKAAGEQDQSSRARGAGPSRMAAPVDLQRARSCVGARRSGRQDPCHQASRGDLVLGTEHANEPDVYRQAGELLVLLHRQKHVPDAGYETRENTKAVAWLDQPHRIGPRTEGRLRREIASWVAPMAMLTPTHGDGQPRHWLVHRSQVRVIDVGWAAMRPDGGPWPVGRPGVLESTRAGIGILCGVRRKFKGRQSVAPSACAGPDRYGGVGAPGR